jgi:hypothetical protein
MKRVLTNINKIGIVVKSVDETVKTYLEEYGIGPWKSWDLNEKSVNEMIMKDKKEIFALRIARAFIGPTIWELMEPLDEHSSFYKFLQEHGEGLHHLGYEVNNFDEAIKFFADINVEINQRGNWAGYKFAYFDTIADLKHIIEIHYSETDHSYPRPAKIYQKHNEKSYTTHPFLKKPTQIGIAVNDIDATVEKFNDKYAIGPWVMFKYYSPKVGKMYYYGEELKDQRFKTTATMLGNIQIELMEPENGKNIYSDWIEKHGEGLHHIQFEYNYPFKDVIKYHLEKKHSVIQQGTINGLTYAYISTDQDLKIISEPLDIPVGFVFPECDYSYPKNLHVKDVIPQ